MVEAEKDIFDDGAADTDVDLGRRLRGSEGLLAAEMDRSPRVHGLRSTRGLHYSGRSRGEEMQWTVTGLVSCVDVEEWERG